MKGIELDIQIVTRVGRIPSVEQLRLWANAALFEIKKAEITIRIVDERESAALNLNFRHRQGPTNVLSFPLMVHHNKDLLLGDIVVCAPLVREEALLQNKPEEAHWAHLVIHGILHLRGYDHIQEADAQEMEALESQILTKLGFELS
jgi:probable rRNA maturation factor